jgi:predicted Mrr-cat superfamily restriction endonuclease
MSSLVTALAKKYEVCANDFTSRWKAGEVPEIKKGDMVVSFHDKPDRPSFLIGKVTGFKDWEEDGTTRYEITGEYNVVAWPDQMEVHSIKDKKYYPPVNGTPSTLGRNMVNVWKID